MTQQDIYLATGVVVLAFAVPALIGAYAERRAPRAAAIASVVGASLVLLANSQIDGGLSFADVPEAFIRIVAHIFR